jgi:hypothetical protein
MRASLYLFFIFLLLVNLQSCTYSYNFYIINLTQNNLTVEYKIKTFATQQDVFNTEPQTGRYNADEPDDKIINFQKSDVVIDKNERKVTCILRPLDVLNIGWTGKEIENKADKIRVFGHVKELRIYSGHDTLISSSIFISELFSRNSDQDVYQLCVDKYLTLRSG